jgi:Na+(H+)/acetate symporter ActP
VYELALASHLVEASLVRQREDSTVPHPAERPTPVAIPLGFLACWLGTVLSSAGGGDRSFEELQVRSQTGLGSEQAVAH